MKTMFPIPHPSMFLHLGAYLKESGLFMRVVPVNFDVEGGRYCHLIRQHEMKLQIIIVLKCGWASLRVFRFSNGKTGLAISAYRLFY